MREVRDVKGLVLVSGATAGMEIFEPEPDPAISSREVVPVVRMRCTR